MNKNDTLFHKLKDQIDLSFDMEFPVLYEINEETLFDISIFCTKKLEQRGGVSLTIKVLNTNAEVTANSLTAKNHYQV